MSEQPNAKEVIDRFQRRQQRAPGAFIIGALALVLIFAGGILLFQWYRNPDAKIFAFLQGTATPTMTATATQTPVPPTATPEPPTATLPPTDTPTITPTPTIAGAFIYTVAEGDSIVSLSERFGVDINHLIEVNELGIGCGIIQGQQLLIPDPNETRPTATLIPAGLPRGYELEYLVKFGDFLSGIAAQFNSTEDAILEANEDLENANEIFPCQILIIPINLVTPIPVIATETPISNVTPGAIATLTPSPTATP